MLSLIKQLFVASFSFSSSLATKCVSLNDEPCMVRPTLINFSPIELNPFKIILDKCNGSCNALSPKMCALKKTKRINMIKNKNEAKTMTKHFSCDSKCKFNNTTCNSNQKWNNETCQCECKNYCKC